MPWPKDHKVKIREQIVKAAAAMLRAKGADGVAVEDVMSEVGLTHGAFYAHFASKDDLVRAALEAAGRQTLERFSEKVADVAPEDRFLEYANAYLSTGHALHPELGCPVAAVGPELARAGARTKRSLGDGIRARIEWMRTLLPKRLRGAREEEVLVGALATMIGGIVLARSLGGEQSEATLAATRAFLERALERQSK